jgi:ribose 5-phosphate isomerase B
MHACRPVDGVRAGSARLLFVSRDSLSLWETSCLWHLVCTCSPGAVGDGLIVPPSWQCQTPNSGHVENLMKVGLAADHAGVGLRDDLAAMLRQLGHEVVDFGAKESVAGDDYPDFVAPMAEAVAAGTVQRGIAICGSGVGACIVANKLSGVRAGLCHDTYSAHQGVEHDDMNVLVLGARVIGCELARELVRAFLAARFTSEPRHVRRLDKVQAVESASMNRGAAAEPGA